MNLKELLNTLESVNTLGFKPEDVSVKLRYTFSELNVRSVKTVIHAGEDVKPVVYVELDA